MYFGKGTYEKGRGDGRQKGQRVRGREGCSTKSVLPLELSWW